jgi:hypothetical protein
MRLLIQCRLHYSQGFILEIWYLNNNMNKEPLPLFQEIDKPLFYPLSNQKSTGHKSRHLV